jgi:hypothetical protein
MLICVINFVHLLTPPEFTEWFKLANQCDIARASTTIDGKLHVLAYDGWQLWEEVKATYPIEDLGEARGYL